MKTISKVEIKPIFVDEIPENLIQNEFYVSNKYNVAVHLCLCGCGNKSVTPLNKNGWFLTQNNNKISLTPSILNTNCPKNYHYILTNNIANVC